MKKFFKYPKKFDVLVIGGGHAGMEAILAANRVANSSDFACALLTQNLDTICQMSCNPAIGGVGKGHMVREIDALGGFMAGNADACGIQFRTLNEKKGVSARSPRAQCDKKYYQFRAKWHLENSGVDIIQGSAKKFIVKDDEIFGVLTNLDIEISANKVILCSGTFLQAIVHVGAKRERGGRMSDQSSEASESLRELGFRIERFKTGTPCRVHGCSIDFSKLERQEGDKEVKPFSFFPENTDYTHWSCNDYRNGLFHVEQLPCYLARTNERTHEIIRRDLRFSAMYSKQIIGSGPRYCPSIEDKIVKFPQRLQHQIFLEPEGKSTHEYYVNGVSTSLPYATQIEFMRSVHGLENVEIIRPGYAVEYDYLPPEQLLETLESKLVKGLYFAGQINGTSGYEEAAGQGLVAGANAALALQGEKEFILPRNLAYIGVMINDLTGKGVLEPYRMFTSRAEFRISLRHDNAHLRLLSLVEKTGLLRGERLAKMRELVKAYKRLSTDCKNIRISGETLEKNLRRQTFGVKDLPQDLRKNYDENLLELFANDIKYSGYIRREQTFASKLEKLREVRLPTNFDYARVGGLRVESVQRLNQFQPENAEKARQIPGMTPTDITLLLIWLKKNGVK